MPNEIAAAAITARLWTYARDERPWGGDAPPAARYRFSGDRKGQHPKDHLARIPDGKITKLDELPPWHWNR